MPRNSDMFKIKVWFTDLAYIAYKQKLYNFQINKKLLEMIDGGWMIEVKILTDTKKQKKCILKALK